MSGPGARAVSSPAAPAPFSAYAQAVEVAPGARTLRISGQVGAHPDGTLGATLEEQVELAWDNVFALLDAAAMGPSDIVDMLVILTDRAAVPVFREARDRRLGGHLACSTMLICALAHPDWQVEIAVTAARAD